MPLTDKEKEQIACLRIGADGNQVATAEEFLRDFRSGNSNRMSLVGELLGEAVASRDPDEVELAILAGFNLGFSEVHINLLSSLAHEDWHYSHEDIASALDEIRTPGCVNSLGFLAQWVPEYLEFDKTRALGSKAVWALKKIGDTSAKKSLQKIAASQTDVIGALAQEKLLELG